MKKEKQDDNNKEILKQTFLPSYLNTKDKNPSIHTGREIQHNLFFFLFLHSSFSTHVLLHPHIHTHTNWYDTQRYEKTKLGLLRGKKGRRCVVFIDQSEKEKGNIYYTCYCLRECLWGGRDVKRNWICI